MSIKIFVSDLDGTFLNRQNQVAPYSVRIIKAALAQGYQFMIATGRSWHSARALLAAVDIDCDFILLNGAEWRKSTGEVLKRQFIGRAELVQILQLLDNAQIEYEINSTLGDFVGPHSIFNNPNILEKASDFLTLSAEALKVYTYTFDPEKLAKMKAQITAIPTITLTSSGSWNLEITSRAVDKAQMLEQVLASYGYSKSECLLFGDGANDLTMFQTFPHTCAMANAIPAVKALAEFTTTTNEDCGVAKLISACLENKLVI